MHAFLTSLCRSATIALCAFPAAADASWESGRHGLGLSCVVSTSGTVLFADAAPLPTTGRRVGIAPQP